MAAWLAYLKSRLLLPEPAGPDEPPAEELAARLAFRLQRLEAMRAAAAQLMARSRLGLDVFARGTPEPLIVERQVHYGDTCSICSRPMPNAASGARPAGATPSCAAGCGR
jgi:segregation and condensation protein A